MGNGAVSLIGATAVKKADPITRGMRCAWNAATSAGFTHIAGWAQLGSKPLRSLTLGRLRPHPVTSRDRPLRRSKREAKLRPGNSAGRRRPETYESDGLCRSLNDYSRASWAEKHFLVLLFFHHQSSALFVPSFFFFR